MLCAWRWGWGCSTDLGSNALVQSMAPGVSCQLCDKCTASCAAANQTCGLAAGIGAVKPVVPPVDISGIPSESRTPFGPFAF